MGILNRIFAGDPRRDLERAEALLDKGEPDRALELARRAADKAPPADQGRAAALVANARDALVAAALEKASLAESSEYFEDAAEWLETALEHVEDGARRAELEERMGALRAQAREADREEEPWEVPGESGGEPATELDPETHYLALIDMLVEGVASRYEGRPAAFRRAYMDLNEGRIAEALAALNQLAVAGSVDPVIRFERGRCRLMLGEAEGALADFEAVWESFGDEPLDLSGEVSVPALWAEAMLALGRPEPVLEKLEDLADPAAGWASLSYRYAEAMLAAGRIDGARKFLASAATTFPSQPVFPYLLAQALARSGERAAAIDCLEAAIAPSCTAGGCARPPKHLPSIRSLAALYLEEGNRPERVRELMTLVAQDSGGRLTNADHALLAGYYEQTGDPEAAERAAAAAARLGEAGPADQGPEAPPALGGRRRPPI